MDYDDKIASGMHGLDYARQFQELFPAAEHVIVQAKHDFYPDGWGLADQWISRAKLYDRYVLWLAVAIDFTPDGAVSALEEPDIHIVEVKKFEKGRDEGGPKWELSFVRFMKGAWEEIVEADGDFEELGLELIQDSPVDRFDTFWRDTSPPPGSSPVPDGIALKAHIRFSM